MGDRRNRAAQSLTLWLRASALVYAAGAVTFGVRPQDAPAVLSRLTGGRLERETPGVYNALASAYMATIAALAWNAAADDPARQHLIPPLLVAKATSSLALLNRYRSTGARGYALGAAVDGTILAVTGALYRAERAR